MDEDVHRYIYPALADPQQPLLTPAGVLAWRQAETRRHRAAIGIVSGIQRPPAATIAVAVRAQKPGRASSLRLCSSAAQARCTRAS